MIPAIARRVETQQADSLAAVSQLIAVSVLWQRVVLDLAGIRPGPNAATLRMIMISAKRYIPMVRPIPACIAQVQISQVFRVLLLQINNG